MRVGSAGGVSVGRANMSSDSNVTASDISPADGGRCQDDLLLGIRQSIARFKEISCILLYLT